MKYENEFRKHFYNEPVFTPRDARNLLMRLGASQGYSKLFLHNQMKKGLKRIGRGAYTFMEDEAAVGFAFRPFYYGLEYALTIHGLWTQMANPVIITRTKAVPGTRKAGGREVTVRRISGPMFFGIEYIKFGTLLVPVSDVEKTLIDFIYYGEPLQDEVMDKILERLDKRKLDSYLGRCGVRLGSMVAASLSGKKIK